MSERFDFNPEDRERRLELKRAKRREARGLERVAEFLRSIAPALERRLVESDLRDFPGDPGLN
jgi:hypothetical protein